jgi:hypothetical protein
MTVGSDHDDRPPMFTFRSPSGQVLATGPLSLLDEAVRARSSAESAIAAAAKAAGELSRIKARSDALDQKERDLSSREGAVGAAFDTLVRNFAAGVDKLACRVDKLEHKTAQAEINSVPDPERPVDDHLAAPLPPPDLEDREQLNAQEAIEKDRADDRDDVPAPPMRPMIHSAFPEPVANHSNEPSFVCGRDRKAWRRAQRRWAAA